MNRTKRLLFSMLTLLCCCTGAWADVTIGTKAEWDAFATNVTNGTSYSGQTVKLTADIGTELDPITTMVGRLNGYAGNGFEGTFDGCGHSIHVSITGNNEIESPFRCIIGATIKNVKVTGSVSGGIHCSGLVGVALSGTCTIRNCEVAVSVTCNGTHCGGIIGHGRSSNTTIENCLFSGSISGPTTATGIFYGWGDGGTHNNVNCLSAGNYTGSSGVNLAKGSGYSITNCYRKTSGGSQGIDASRMTATELVTALQNNSPVEVWVQDPLTNQPMLKTFATAPYTIPSSGIGTFSAKAKFAVPEGLTAYYCKEYDSENETIGVVAVDGVVPANTGVVLRGEPGTYTLTGTNSDAATITGNALVAVTEATHVDAVSGDYTNFMMKNGKFILIENSEDDVKMPANRAYLQILTELVPPNTAEARSIMLDWDDDATGIQAVRDSRPAVDGYYNLAGQRVAHPTKGLYIVGGRKVVIK